MGLARASPTAGSKAHHQSGCAPRHSSSLARQPARILDTGMHACSCRGMLGEGPTQNTCDSSDPERTGLDSEERDTYLFCL